MALNLKNSAVETLVEEVAEMTGETKTEAVRKALAERKERLALKSLQRQDREERFLRYLREEIWPNVPPGELGRVLTKAEEEEILGLGPDGV
ncbi:MAG TPA: type II toxin-antitoxin system VapB family antitoxin [Thermoanaerobaculia bacterium]|nr:type II toxin-antitoxin system VapB family antitoxin [Thermoanaerobaculia bacterium]